jgi:hypothetical protein
VPAVRAGAATVGEPAVKGVQAEAFVAGMCPCAFPYIVHVLWNLDRIFAILFMYCATCWTWFEFKSYCPCTVQHVELDSNLNHIVHVLFNNLIVKCVQYDLSMSITIVHFGNTW